MARGAASAPRPSLFGLALGLFARALWITFVITTPLLGAWVASSLAAHANGPVALAAAVGLLLFPVLPALWELWGGHRRRKKGDTSKRVLTLTDRVILRTLAINLLFLGVLLGSRPEAAFASLSTRGDWMLDGREDGTSTWARGVLFQAADRLEWLYLAVQEKPYGESDEPTPQPSTPTPTAPTAVPAGTTPAVPTAAPSAPPSPTAAPSMPASAAPSASAAPAPSAGPSAAPEPAQPENQEHAPSAMPTPSWPLPPTLHPVVAGMPRDAETSIAAVAKYIAEREPSEVGRVKAAHDWVADRIAYDGEAYVARHERRLPDQDAEVVFQRRLGVCAGYALLFRALGKELGLAVSFVGGVARSSGMDETGEGHAWNAVRLGLQTYLIDVTWDSGSLDGAKFEKGYRADYLFTPPEAFGIDHFPEQPEWQLRQAPISRGDFFRQPMLAPRFFADRRELVTPTRSQVTVDGDFDAELRNPGKLFTLATFAREGAELRSDCQVTPGELTRIHCALPGEGSYVVRMYSNEKRYGSFAYMGQFQALRRAP
jgi:hypothetical protein